MSEEKISESFQQWQKISAKISKKTNSGVDVWTISIPVDMKAEADSSPRSAQTWSAAPPGPDKSACGLSITGYDIISQPDTGRLRRTIWLLILTACVVNMVYQVSISVVKYSKNEVMTSWTTHTRGRSDVHFPAVSVCNGNMWKKSAVEDYFNGEHTVRDWDDQDYELFRWEDDLQQFLWNVSYHAEDIVADCRYNGERCEDVGVEVVEAQMEFGYHCTTLIPRQTPVRSWTESQLGLVLHDLEKYPYRTHEDWQVFVHPPSVPLSTWTRYTGWYTPASVGHAEHLQLDVMRRGSRRLQQGSATRGSEPCLEDASSSPGRHVRCVLGCFWRTFQQTDSPCRLPQMRGAPPHLPLCASFEQVEPLREWMWGVGEQEAAEVAKTCNCTVPCHTEAFLKRSWSRRDLVHPDITLSDDSFILTKDTLSATVGVQLWSESTAMTESWRYSGNQLLSDIGGHMGLMLGGSVLTVVEILDRAIAYCSVIRRRRLATQDRRQSVDSLA